MDRELPTFENWAADPRNATLERMVWRLPAYRLAAYALHVGWDDACRLSGLPLTAPVASQLYRALGSIGANIAEGYSRSSGRDRVRFYEYALGSARECVVWYRAASPTLGAATVTFRQDVLHRLICMLLIVIPRERARSSARMA
ncbi:MAG: four helix bundle protein [Gemmatirosa sp.]